MPHKAWESFQTGNISRSLSNLYFFGNIIIIIIFWLPVLRLKETRALLQIELGLMLSALHAIAHKGSLPLRLSLKSLSGSDSADLPRTLGLGPLLFSNWLLFLPNTTTYFLLLHKHCVGKAYTQTHLTQDQGAPPSRGLSVAYQTLPQHSHSRALSLREALRAGARNQYM